MTLSRYVVETNGKLHNIMTRESLPLDTTEDVLARQLFLDGQEREALDHRLFQPPKSLELRIVGTWECNLRCRHCSVLYQLVDRDKGKVCPELVSNFVNLYLSRYNHIKSVYVTFIGGEILLKSQNCIDVLKRIKETVPADVKIAASATTNLAVDLDRTNIEFLSMLSNLLISIDGTEEQHNWQRIPYKNKELKPFQKSYANIKRLIKLGMLEKLQVQAAMQQKVMSMESKLEYYTNFLKLGFKEHQIEYASVHPTQQNPEPDEQYLEGLKKVRLYVRPCCDYRYMATFLVNSQNQLFGSYYDTSIDSKMADLTAVDLDELEKAYRKKILEKMAIMQDEVCMKQCPVVSYCWGGCVNGDFFNKGKPSNYCNREALTEFVNKRAKEGTLVKE